MSSHHFQKFQEIFQRCHQSHCQVSPLQPDCRPCLESHKNLPLCLLCQPSWTRLSPIFSLFPLFSSRNNIVILLIIIIHFPTRTEFTSWMMCMYLVIFLWPIQLSLSATRSPTTHTAITTGSMP